MPFNPRAHRSFKTLDKLNVCGVTCSQVVISGFHELSRKFLQSILSEHTALRLCLIKDLDNFWSLNKI